LREFAPPRQLHRYAAHSKSMNSTGGKIELDYVAQISSLSPENLLRFYEILAHNLTVSVRGVWSDETLTDSQKVERIKWLNEIMHQITSKTAALRRHCYDYTEADTWKMMQHYISLCPPLAADIAFATTSSYQAVTHSADAA
jgi:hypothetical protein